MYQKFTKSEDASKRSGEMESRDHSRNAASPKSLMSRVNIEQKVLLFLIAISVNVVSTFAQDVITLKNGVDIKALVQEIGETDIKYKKFDNPNGPNYSMKKSEIFMIRYANGSKDVFTESVPERTTTTTPSETKIQPSVQRQTETPLEPLSLRRNRVYNSNGKELSVYELTSVLSDVPEALRSYRSGRSLVTFGTILSSTGGVIIGVHLGMVLSNDEREINGLVLGVGGGLSVAGIIMGAVGGSKSKAAVEIYNSAVQRQHTSSISLNLGITQSGGIGLTLNF